MHYRQGKCPKSKKGGGGKGMCTALHGWTPFCCDICQPNPWHKNQKTEVKSELVMIDSDRLAYTLAASLVCALLAAWLNKIFC